MQAFSKVSKKSLVVSVDRSSGWRSQMPQETNYRKSRRVFEVLHSQAHGRPQVIRTYRETCCRCKQFKGLKKICFQCSELPVGDIRGNEKTGLRFVGYVKKVKNERGDPLH